MKIVNRKEFLLLAEGTLYQTYNETAEFGTLCIKWDTIGQPDTSRDWFYTNLNQIDENQSQRCIYDLIEAGRPFEFDIDMMGREALYEHDQLYAVYSQEDLKRLIEKLKTLVDTPKIVLPDSATLFTEGVTPKFELKKREK